MAQKIKKMSGEKRVIILFIILLGLIVLIFIGKIVYDEITLGCWNTIYSAYEDKEVFDIKDYSCEDLREMILLGVYPREIHTRTTHYKCNGDLDISGYGGIEEYPFYDYDYKESYKNKCLEINHDTKE